MDAHLKSRLIGILPIKSKYSEWRFIVWADHICQLTDDNLGQIITFLCQKLLKKASDERMQPIKMEISVSRAIEDYLTKSNLRNRRVLKPDFR